MFKRWFSRSNKSPECVTEFSGRHIHASKLEDLLNAKFKEGYTVQLRDNYYKVIAKSEFTRDDIRKCC
ncbi:hypothetical protein F4810DRAFT_643327 [Camillea tinctor]|nr:hypothetical protein F4810DRAFT_643327 [Camillea tinctor]